VWIALNHADGGYGGGVLVIGPARANLGSPGYRLAEYVALLYGNTAQYGGGLAVVAGSGDNQDGFALLFTTDAGHPLWFDGNVATHVGGAIYAHPNAGVGSGDASVCGGDVRLSGNTAAEGSAIYADEQYDAITGYSGASVSLGPERIHAAVPCGGDEPPSMFDAVACTSTDCNRIDGNLALDGSGQPTAGSTILVQSNAYVALDHARVLDNHGAHVLRVVANDSNSSVNPSTGDLSDCLVAGNVVGGNLVIADSQTRTKIDNCTITGNAIGSGAVLRSDGVLDVFDTIFAQGLTSTLTYTGGNANNLTIDHVLSMEVASLAQGAHVIQGDPSFVNTATGDYHLMPGSLAVDVAPALGGDDFDLDGRLRDQDIASVPNLDGVRDLGAYERQLRYCGAADTVFCATFDYD
jgi:predicted outer membrane repeat protein